MKRGVTNAHLEPGEHFRWHNCLSHFGGGHGCDARRLDAILGTFKSKGTCIGDQTHLGSRVLEKKCINEM